jgi:hypothetical protein
MWRQRWVGLHFDDSYMAHLDVWTCCCQDRWDCAGKGREGPRLVTETTSCGGPCLQTSSVGGSMTEHAAITVLVSIQRQTCSKTPL